MMPSTALLPPSRSFFDDSNESLQVTIPHSRPISSRKGVNEPVDTSGYENERRPSAASFTTVGSQDSGSKTSNGRSSYKKLAGFFADDANGRESPHSSETSIAPAGYRENSIHSHRTRNNSLQTNHDGRPTTPATSRPRTPLPSSDVVPWLFQDFKVSLFDGILCVTQLHYIGLSTVQ